MGNFCETEADLRRLLQLVQLHRPPEFGEYDIANMLTYPLLTNGPRTLIQNLKELLSFCLKYRYAAEQAGSGAVWFWFGYSYHKRADHARTFRRVVSTAPDHMFIRVVGRKVPSRRLLSLWRPLRWLAAYRKAGLPEELAAFVVCNLFSAYCELQELNRLVRQHPDSCRAFVCWCDVHRSDSLPVQYFKMRGIPTVTLQHAHFPAAELSGRLAYTNSLSDYFLCYGAFTARTAESLGVRTGKMIPLGMPEQINAVLPRHSRSSGVSAFGVSLSFVLYSQENRQLLHVASLVAQKYNWDYIIRPHPSLDMEEYASFFRSDPHARLQPAGLSLNDFAHSTQFVVLGQSNVQFSLLAELVPSFRYSASCAGDRFSSLDWNRFSSAEELFQLIDHYREDPAWMENEMIRSREQTMTQGDIRANYANFFQQLIQPRL